MGQPATCRAAPNDPNEHTPPEPPICSVCPNIRGSLYQSLSLRQIRPCKVLQYPYSGEWTSEGENSDTGVLMMENCGIPAPPLALNFTKRRGNGHYLAVADEEGYMTIFNTNRPLPRMIYDQAKTGDIRSARWLAHSNAIFDACWIKEDNQMLTGSGDQTIKLWDIERQIKLGVMKGHTGSVKSLCANPTQSDLFVSGARDGCVSFWDIRTPAAAQNMPGAVSYGPVAKVKDAHKGFTAKFRRRQGYTRSVTAVLYLKDDRVVATAGANDGVVKYWDTRKLKTPIARTPPEGVEASSLGKNGNRLHGIAGLSQNPSGTRLIATCVDSKIYMYDVLRPEKGVLKIFSGHVMGTFYIKAAFSPDGSHILSGSSDYNAYLWKVAGPGNNPTVLEGHMQEVTAVTWCPTDFCKIATCSDDYTVRIWKMREPQFAPRVGGGSMTSLPPSAVEPETPMSPCAPLTSMQIEQEETLRPDTNSCKDTAEATGTVLALQRSNSLKEVTPPSKRFKALQMLSDGNDLHEAMTEEQSPQPKVVRSPFSVLSPPGSLSRRRKTIVDYFGLQPQPSEACAIHGGED